MPYHCGRMVLFLLLLSAAGAGATPESANHCLDCHPYTIDHFAPGHDFARDECGPCHRGDNSITDKAQAHNDLLPFPGLLANASETCGQCHHRQVQEVGRSLMHSGRGMVATTRKVFGESGAAANSATLSQLGDTPADSLLRKLCAGCHLGQPKRTHGSDPTFDRGGGCLACHIDHYPESGHPALTARVGDGRCFGCHSRSGRISLNYVGLAETDAAPGDGASPLLQLEDGRRVQVMPPDLHHRAGMGCTDCHTLAGVMGDGRVYRHQREAVEITCEDCHRNQAAGLTIAAWPERYRNLARRIPFPVDDKHRFPTASRGSPLWHIELTGDGARLYRKDGGGVLPLPRYTGASHPLRKEHRRLACSACHSQWAPQCYGCHSRYDPDGEQWDHTLRRVTPGRWVEARSRVRNGPPPLGVTADDRIEPVVPGMVMTVEHPDWKQPRFVRRFSRLSPHTTGPARSCISCHRSPTALGLGEGKLRRVEGAWRFRPRHPLLQDGLPADAWTDLEGRGGGNADGGVRPFTPREIRRILDVPLPEGSRR
ncbi:MAG TPA: hypothetical protein ENK50_11680 [Sedimenticola sp.]|nr:hypothetical protein [Sedimenticola sp.]